MCLPFKTKYQMQLVSSIFTRGPVVYSESQGYEDAWITLGLPTGNYLFGVNAYGSGSTDMDRFLYWKNIIDKLWTAFGAKLIITEHNVVLDVGSTKIRGLSYSSPGFEDVADIELIKRYEYAKELGITQIYLYGTAEYSMFANTYPSTDADDAYIEGDFKPVIDKIRGINTNKVFIGTNTLT